MQVVLYQEDGFVRRAVGTGVYGVVREIFGLISVPNSIGLDLLNSSRQYIHTESFAQAGKMAMKGVTPSPNPFP
jgi:hypothetical protein